MKERDSNIELLRIVATLFILILHCNGWFLREWGGITGWNTGNSVFAACRILVQNVSELGVDVFILITGFYGIRPKLKSIVNLFTLLLFFYVGCYLLECVLGKPFVITDLFSHMMAFSTHNWFVNSYLFLMLLSPLINAFIDSSSTKKLGMYTILFCATTLYFGYYVENEYWYYNKAYSVTMMIGVYLIGRYMNRMTSVIDRIYYNYIVAAFIGVIGLMFVIRILSTNEEAWLHYGSPITMVAASILFILFYRMPKFHSKLINWVGASCLAAFVLHTCEPLLTWLANKDVYYYTQDVYPIYCLKIGV